MDRILVGIVTGALAFVIGFGSGALLTRPDRIEIEKLIKQAKQEASQAKERASRAIEDRDRAMVELKQTKEQASSAINERDFAVVELKYTKDEYKRIVKKLSEFQDAMIAETEKKRKKSQNVMDNLLEAMTKGIRGPEIISLAGLEGVWVLVVPLSEETKAYGLTEQGLQTDTELRLRQNGIKVLSEKEWEESGGFPFLIVHVFTEIERFKRIGMANVKIDLHLTQAVSLLRDPAILCVGRTWETHGVEGVTIDDNLKNIRQKVKDYVDVFINDYLAANPKK